MMTTTEVLAFALGRVFARQTQSFGAEQHKAALAHVSALRKAGKCRDEEADEAQVRLGNQSAIRQWAVKHGIITQDDDALATAVKAEIDKVLEAEKAEMTKAMQK